MTTNNQFLKQIAERVTDTEITGTHSDNYYWNLIATTVCNKTYTGVQCNGKYVKDIAEVICATTFSEHHFNNYYYRRMALEYVSTLEHTNDNYLLGVIAENITLGTTVRITSATQSVEYGSNVSVSATVLDSSRQPVSSATVTFKDGNTTLGTATTNSDGVATYTDNTLSIGSHTITATYDNVTSGSVSVTVTKITPTISLSATDDSVTYGDSISLSGVLSVGSGETVTIYDGSTSLGTVTTTTDGAFSKTITDATVGTHNYTAVYGGDSTYDGVTSSNVNVNVEGVSTGLEINVPLSLVYSDDFNITGTLKDENDNPISDAPIGLKVGDTIVDAETTDANGEVSFTQSPVSMGTHTFQLVYDGDSTHNASTSSAVTRNINKETSVVSVTTPSTSSTTIYSDGTLTISGNLSDDDNTPIANASIVVKEGSTTLATLTTDSDGDFSGSVSDLSVGTHTIRIDYPENSNYTESYIDKTVVVESPTLSLTSDKSILSKTDNESATLTATYTGASVSGRTVSFKVYKSSDDSLLETLQSQTTDSNGECSVTYSSHGYGDVYIKAECMLLIQRYEVYDYYGYRANGSATFGSSWEFSNIFDLNNIGDCEIEAEISATGNKGFGLAFKKTNDGVNSYYIRGQVDGAGYFGTYVDDGSTDYTTYSTQYTANTYFKVYMKIQNGTITVTHNGKTHTTTKNPHQRYLGLHSWNSSKTINFKNLIVKKL